MIYYWSIYDSLFNIHASVELIIYSIRFKCLDTHKKYIYVRISLYFTYNDFTVVFEIKDKVQNKKIYRNGNGNGNLPARFSLTQACNKFQCCIGQESKNFILNYSNISPNYAPDFDLNLNIYRTRAI